MKCPHCEGTGTLERFTVGDAIVAYRKAKGLTQEQLADKAEIGRSQIANIETNRADPSLSLLRRLADALGVKMGDLIDN